MAHLDVSHLPPEARPTGTWAAALLHALARDEAAGRRTPRLTEDGMATWARFRGRLGAADLVALLFEDAAVGYRVPFDPGALGEPLQLDLLTDAVAEKWLAKVPSLDLAAKASDYVDEQAKALGLPASLPVPKLPAIEPGHRVLELPGTGGFLAHRLLGAQPGLTLHSQVTVACGSWQELTLAGIIALEARAPSTDFLVRATPEELHESGHPLRKRTFDIVVGLHPDRGGRLQMKDQLAVWFHPATIVLV